MGEIADQIIDQLIHDNLFRRRRRTYQSGSGDFMWRTADGEIVPMEDMTTRHLKHSLAYCERNGNPGKAKQLRKVLADRQADGE